MRCSSGQLVASGGCWVGYRRSSSCGRRRLRARPAADARGDHRIASGQSSSPGARSFGPKGCDAAQPAGSIDVEIHFGRRLGHARRGGDRRSSRRSAPSSASRSAKARGLARRTATPMRAAATSINQRLSERRARRREALSRRRGSECPTIPSSRSATARRSRRTRPIPMPAKTGVSRSRCFPRAARRPTPRTGADDMADGRTYPSRPDPCGQCRHHSRRQGADRAPRPAAGARALYAAGRRRRGRREPRSRRWRARCGRRPASPSSRSRSPVIARRSCATRTAGSSGIS